MNKLFQAQVIATREVLIQAFTFLGEQGDQNKSVLKMTQWSRL